MSSSPREKEEQGSAAGARSPLLVVPRVFGANKKKKTVREFVYESYPQRKIALRIAYHGHVHDGLAKQDETDNTVEAFVYEALARVRLIPASGPEKFSRCGRTDKGVSALGNVVSVMARASCWPTDTPQQPPLDYATMLNGVLPPTVRVVGFALVDDDFDARFSCVSRTYRYYFCHRGLNLAAMRQAAQSMLGTHSFRNLCKMDVINVSNFERAVTSVGIYNSEQLPEVISFFEITANSFLYHQIRCTMEVLFLIGRGLESPDVMTELLQRGDAKPQYPLADGTPLVLWECGFKGVHWHISHKAFQSAERELQDICTALMIRSCVCGAMRQQLFQWYGDHEDVCAPSHPAARTQASASTPRTMVVTRWQPAAPSPSFSPAGEQAVTEAGSGLPDRPWERRVVDSWSITGCDWTDQRTSGSLKSRKYDLFNALRYEDEVLSAPPTPGVASRAGQAEAVAGPSAAASTSPVPPVFKPHGYIPLLSRDRERTYDEQVAELGDRKRARYELNAEKKAAGQTRGETRRARQLAQKEEPITE